MKLPTVLLWKWGKAYTAAHVNAAVRSLRRLASAPLRIVVITDDPTGIEGCETFPSWDYPVVHSPGVRTGAGCWRRLRLFRRDAELIEAFGPRVVSVDLDALWLRDPVPLWTRQEPFVGWRARNRTPATYNGSMFLMDIGAYEMVWNTFDPATTLKHLAALGYIGSDQAVWSRALGPNMPHWTSADGVYSYRYDWASIKDATVIFFHGPVKPWSDGAPLWIRDAYARA